MQWGRRCDIGCESWPDEPIYQKCPICGGQTTRYSNLEPVSQEEGRSAIRAAAFERFYEHHCRERGQTVDGPLPCSADIDARYPLRKRGLGAPGAPRPLGGGGVSVQREAGAS